MLSRAHSDLPPEIEATIERVIVACIEVHRHLGPGFLESGYQRAVCIELELRGVPFVREKSSENGTVLK